MPNEPRLPVDRITYRDGQLLTARDLRDDKRRDDTLRWLHTRYLHETWGIALGFEVQIGVGDVSVLISPGYAVDNAGRDLVLDEVINAPIPNVSGLAAFVLTISYQDDAAYRARRDLACICVSSRGLGPRNEQPLLSWRQPQEVRFGPEVPLVSVAVESGKINGALDFRVRRNARRLVRPHIGWGSAEPGLTGWEEGILTDPQGTDTGIAWLHVTIDTSQAGFTKTPLYFAAIHGAGSSWPGGERPALFGNPLGFISDPAADHFTYWIISAADVPQGVPFAWDPQHPPWSLYWLGLESVTGCAPVLGPHPIFHPLMSGANQ